MSLLQTNDIFITFKKLLWQQRRIKWLGNPSHTQKWGIPIWRRWSVEGWGRIQRSVWYQKKPWKTRKLNLLFDTGTLSCHDKKIWCLPLVNLFHIMFCFLKFSLYIFRNKQNMCISKIWLILLNIPWLKCMKFYTSRLSHECFTV